LTAAAVKVTVVPAQTLLAEAETETLTGSSGFTIIDIIFDEAGLFEMQTVIEEDRMHCTWSPLTGVQVNTELLPPAFDPFTFH
jgi:hypothetical protein